MEKYCCKKYEEIFGINNIRPLTLKLWYIFAYFKNCPFCGKKLKAKNIKKMEDIIL